MADRGEDPGDRRLKAGLTDRLNDRPRPPPLELPGDLYEPPGRISEPVLRTAGRREPVSVGGHQRHHGRIVEHLLEVLLAALGISGSADELGVHPGDD
jgi:hypothetical protein